MRLRISLRALLVLLVLISIGCWVVKLKLDKRQAELELNKFAHEKNALVLYWVDVNNELVTPTPHNPTKLEVELNPFIWPNRYIAVLDLSNVSIGVSELDELSTILRRLRIPIWQIKFRDKSVSDKEILNFAKEFNRTIVYLGKDIVEY